MDEENQRLRILEMIESGEINAEEGWNRLQSLAEDAAEEPQDAAPFPTVEVIQPVSLPEDGTSRSMPPIPDFDVWRRLWTIPLWVGVGVVILFAYFLAQAAQAGSTFWVLCASLPFALGVLLIVIGWGSRTARWLHLRVQQPPGRTPQRVVISFPLPLHFAGWIVRTFRNYIPGMDRVDAEAMLAALGQSTSPDNPIYIEVDEGDGEKVQIFIG